MATVFLLKVGCLDTGSDIVGIFSSLDNARQRAKEIVESKTKRYQPDYFDIYSTLIDVGELIHIETIKPI